jgi:hypothetical protein
MQNVRTAYPPLRVGYSGRAIQTLGSEEFDWTNCGLSDSDLPNYISFMVRLLKWAPLKARHLKANLSSQMYEKSHCRFSYNNIPIRGFLAWGVKLAFNCFRTALQSEFPYWREKALDFRF